MAVIEYVWVEVKVPDRIKFDCGKCDGGKLIQLRCEPQRSRYNEAIMCGDCKRVLWVA